MLGYEFPETVMMVGKEQVCFLTSVRKAAILKQLTDELGIEKVRVYGREKERGKGQAVMEEFWAALPPSMGPAKLGFFGKDRIEGPMYSEWASFFEKQEKELVELAPSVSLLLATKDAAELEAISIAAKTSAVLMESYVATKILSCIDDGKRVTHAELTETVEGHVQDQLGRYRSKLPAKMSPDMVDICYPPIIQSGGAYSLKPSAVSTEEQLHAGVVLCSLGIRYKSYCSNVGRTLLVNPEKPQEDELVFLMSLEQHLVTQLAPGTKLCDVYESGVQYVKQHRPELSGHLVGNFGFSMGLEFRESDYAINSKCQKPIEPGMIFNLAVGFQGLIKEGAKNPKDQSYALMVADTVLITADGKAELLTPCLSALKDVSYVFKTGGRGTRSAAAAAAPIKTRLRNNQANVEAEKERKDHQKALMAASTKEALSRHSGATEEEGTTKAVAVQKVESYKKEAAFPRDLCRDWKIAVDKRNETLILPIQGFAVPFHISTVKNVTKSDEGDFVCLRINFNTPGRTFGKKDTQPQFENPQAEFIRGVVFRSADAARVQDTFKDIQDLRKMVTEREAARKERSDLVEQAELVEMSGKRPARLADVYVRPQIESRRSPGDVEIHQNGLRFKTQLKADQRIDVLFSNIKHFLFQPCDNESIVILHLHLHHPIMVGKKKTKDIQLYREAIDSLVDETSGRRTRMRFGDEDEIAQEAEERKRRADANAEFKNFAERVIEQTRSAVSVDMPYTDLSFSGIHTKHNVLIQPTTDCIVQLTEAPFLVVTMAEVEIVYLERVMFGLKNFDVVFVFKDHARPPVSVNSVPVSNLDTVKQLIDSFDVPFAESKINFNWSNVLKTIKEDPVDFYENGGWASLQPDEENDSDEEEELSSAYEPDDSDDEVEEEEDEEEEDESEFSESEEESEDDFSDEDEESDAPDWDELERRAAKEDARRESAVGTSKAGAKRAALPAKKPLPKRR